MPGFVGELTRTGNALLIRVTVIAASGGLLFGYEPGEIFPVGVRGPAMSVCTIFNWGANFLVAQTFLTLSGAISRQGVLFLYAVLAVASVSFFTFRVPEQGPQPGGHPGRPRRRRTGLTTPSRTREEHKCP